MNVILLSV